MHRSARRRGTVALVLSAVLTLSSCALAPLPGTPDPDGFYLPEGIWAIGASVEGLVLAPTYGSPARFGPFFGDRMVLAALAEDIVAWSLSQWAEAGVIPLGVGPTYGSLALRRPPIDGSSLRAVLYSYGAAGAYRKSATDANPDMAGATLITLETVFDMMLAGNDPEANEAALVVPGVGVRIDAYDASVDGFAERQTLPAAGFAGELVSAFLPYAVAVDDLADPPAPALVLTRGVMSHVYVAPRDGGAPSASFDLGLDARKLRCLASDGTTVGAPAFLCAATLFGDDALALMTWEGTVDAAEAADVAPVGDGPVGLDLRWKGDGNAYVLTANYGDATVTELEVTAFGEVVDSTTLATPDGCVGSGHALYVEDDEALHVVGSCYGSGDLFSMRSSWDD